MYVTETDAAFARQRAMHVALLLIATLCILAFLMFLFRPFLAQVRKEGRRVAELLVQLPAEIDLDGLVATLTDISRADTTVVAAAASPLGGPGMMRWSGLTPGGPGGAGGQQTAMMPMFGGGASGGGQRPQVGGGVDGGGDRFFTPRPGPQEPTGWSSGNGGGGDGGGVRRRAGAGRRVAPQEGEF
jgi:hypothetical protein